MSYFQIRRVAMITGEYPPTPGGVGDYTACLADALRQRGIGSVILTSTAVDLPSSETVLRVMPSWGLTDVLTVLRHIRMTNPDVVVIQYQTGAFHMRLLPNLIPALLRLQRVRARVAVVFHDLKEPWVAPKCSWLGRLANCVLARTADVVVVTNHQDRQALRKRYGAVRHETLVPIGSNVSNVMIHPRAPAGVGEVVSEATGREEVRASLGIEPHSIAVGFFGFVNEWKGVDILVEAISRARGDGAQLRLVFIGGGRRLGASYSFSYADRILRRIAELGLDSSTIWTGYGDERAVSGWLNAIDFIALPFVGGYSFRHGTLVAAITHGLAMITTDAPGDVSEPDRFDLTPLRHGVTAEIVPSQDVPALAAAIRRLAGDPVYRSTLANGAAALAPTFSWDSIAGKLVSAVERADR